VEVEVELAEIESLPIGGYTSLQRHLAPGTSRRVILYLLQGLTVPYFEIGLVTNSSMLGLASKPCAACRGPHSKCHTLLLSH